MASATKNKNKQANRAAKQGEPGGGNTPNGKADRKGESGFFTVYKRGQGYWTRLVTGLSVFGMVTATVWFIYNELFVVFGLRDSPLRPGISLGLFVAACVGLWWYLNKPTAADFLIATDSEMKKVNWTSRADLIASTKVVVAFMFMVAAYLFVMDIFFGFFFQLINVLRVNPLEALFGG